MRQVDAFVGDVILGDRRVMSALGRLVRHRQFVRLGRQDARSACRPRFRSRVVRYRPCVHWAFAHRQRALPRLLHGGAMGLESDAERPQHRRRERADLVERAVAARWTRRGWFSLRRHDAGQTSRARSVGADLGDGGPFAHRGMWRNVRRLSRQAYAIALLCAAAWSGQQAAFGVQPPVPSAP